MEDLNIYPAVAALSAQGIENCEDHPMFQKFNLRPRIINLYDSYDSAVTLLNSSHAWTLMPDILVKKYGNRLESHIPRSWNAPYKISAVWPKYRVRTNVLDFLIQEFIKNFH